MCGPAELLDANSSTRTLFYFRLPNEFTVSSDKSKNSGFGLIFDNARELEPILTKNFIVDIVALEVFGLILFIFYGLFTEFAVLRQLDIISEITYEALVQSKNYYQEYYSKSSGSKDQAGNEKNEIVRMATLAAEAFENNVSDLKRKRNEIVIQKVESSFSADELRLISLYCGRPEEEFEVIRGRRRGRKKLKGKQLRAHGFVFLIDVGQASTGIITLDTVLNDPFALEIFKNYCVRDPMTHKLQYPARRSVLFLLSVLFYRSLAETGDTETRIQYMKTICEDFFGGIEGLSQKSNCLDDIGLSPAIRANLFALAEESISTKRLKKTIFEEACHAVHEYLENIVFPKFTRSIAFSLVKATLGRKEALFQCLEPTKNRMGASSTSKNQELLLLKNETNGTVLSRKTFGYITMNLLQ